MACKFFEMLENRWNVGARVCIGLDTDRTKLPEPFVGDIDDILEFNTVIINQTWDLALAYKPNAAFYTKSSKLEVLEETLAYIRERAPDVPVILDAKRADIGNTNLGYVEEAFGELIGKERVNGFDAVTVNPYFGMEAMRPFLDQKDKGIIVLCRTSNPGAGEIQDLRVHTGYALGVAMTKPLYQIVADRVYDAWNYNKNCALVVGATYPAQLGEVRKIVGDMPILIPGIGAQGGDLKQSVCNGVNSRKRGIIINSSSGIIFAKDPRAEAQKLTDSINAILETL